MIWISFFQTIQSHHSHMIEINTETTSFAMMGQGSGEACVPEQQITLQNYSQTSANSVGSPVMISSARIDSTRKRKANCKSFLEEKLWCQNCKRKKKCSADFGKVDKRCWCSGCRSGKICDRSQVSQFDIRF